MPTSLPRSARQGRFTPDLHDPLIPHVAASEPYILHDPEQVSCVGSVLCNILHNISKRQATIGSRRSKSWSVRRVVIRVFAENLVGLGGFLAVCFLYKTNPNPTKKHLLWEKSGPDATFEPNLPWVGLHLGWGVIKIFICFSNPTWFGKLQIPYSRH